METAELILVVDDEETIRIVVGDALQALGYRVHTAANAEQALQAYAKTAFDLALIDLKMPGAMDGMGLIAEIRRQSSKMGIIVMTGYGTLESAVAALRQGACDYIAKPASLAQIVESVQRGLAKKHEDARHQQLIEDLEQTLHKLKQEVDSSSTDAATAATPGSPTHQNTLTMDRHMRTVRKNEEELGLTATEFDLLDYLMTHADRVVMPSELAKEILGYDLDEPDARPIVRVHIQRLRQKLDDDPVQPQYVLNVRAKGYRFIG
jgi:DNA-binding response OmpR family regulator